MIKILPKYPILLLSPLFGILLFTGLYICAAWIYPGGSRVYPMATSFSLLYNYWCDLFDIVTPNGSTNPARAVAIMAMIILALSFAVLWNLLPRLFEVKNRRQTGIKYAGTGSMLIAVFLFTKFHEAVIDLGGLLGGIAVTLTFIELYKSGYKTLFIMGMVCLAMCCFNYFIYETGILLYVLAVTQKITFLLFFVWAGWMNLVLFRRFLAV